MPAEFELKIPAVGESVTEVQIGQWRKREGESVHRDEPVVEIESDKATVDVIAPVAGTVGKILKQAGDRAAIGEVIGFVNAADEAAASGDGQKLPSGTSVSVKKRGSQTTVGSVQAAEPAQGTSQHAPSAQAPPPHIQLPQTKGAGDTVMPAAERLMAEHGLAPGSVQGTGPGGRVLKEDVQRHIAGSPAPAAQPDKRKPETAPPTSQSRVAPPATSPAPQPPSLAPAPIRAEKIDYPIAPQPAGAPNREEEFVVMSPIRRRIAERLVEAQRTAALLTTFNEIDMGEVMALRNKFKETYQEKYGVKLGFMSFFVKAVVDALKMVPQVNAEIREPHVVYKNYYDIGIAVGGGKGLVVPILRNAEFMSFAEIERQIGDFARRAQENKIRLEELQGGTFTISNGGVYGSLLSTPIVNPPQSAILGLHAIQDRPVAKSGQVVIRPMMYVALTYDHRIVDGREAVTFLKRIKEAIEDPTRLLIEV
jgi:2-oxoglutarate dehydrogenase E2 component (dihydrolipoamide succinyltransferase)